MTIDWSKPIQRRDGLKARLIGSIESPYPRVVAFTTSTGEAISLYGESGKFVSFGRGPDGCDLINIPVETVEYHNIYSYGNVYAYETLEAAMDGRSTRPKKPEVSSSCYTAKITKVNGIVVASEVIQPS